MSDWEIIKIIIDFILKLVAFFKSSDDTSTEDNSEPAERQAMVN
mgnify:CR=1 FL=1